MALLSKIFDGSADFDYLDPETGEEYDYDSDNPVLGISRNQWNNENAVPPTPENVHVVFYLDPSRPGLKG